MKFTVLTILSVQFSSIKCIRHVVQPSSLFVYRTFQIETVTSFTLNLK